MYNLHPIIVHFPIALLCVYTLIVVLPFHKWFPQIGWKHISSTLLLFGLAGAALSLATGETAEHMLRRSRDLIELHADFAGFSVFFYAIPTVAVLIEILFHFYPKMKELQILKTIYKIFSQKYITLIAAILGFICLLLTGILGGAIVYGTSADPLAQPVLDFFQIQAPVELK